MTQRSSSHAARVTPSPSSHFAQWAALLSVPALALLLPLATSRASVLDFVAYVLVYGLLAMSLNLLIGGTGLVSFGHAMFFALGAYVFAVCLSRESGVGLSMLAAIGVSMAAAAVVGAFCVRLQHTYFSFITLAFAMVFANTVDLASGITGGDSGLTASAARLTLAGFDIGSGTPRYVFITAVFAVATIALLAIMHSAFGATLRLVRDNADRATCLGVNVYLARLVSFTLAGTFAGVSGMLATFLVAGAYPSFTAWTTSGEAIFAILLGGVNVFWGPVLGSAILRGLIDFTTVSTGHTGLVLGVLLLVIVLGLRQSPMDWLMTRLRARRAATAATDRQITAKEEQHA